jgi:PAS domain S-box-containing protein
MIGKVSIRKVLKQDGSMAYLEGIIEDITEKKISEEKLKKYTEEITDLYENAPCGYQSLAADGTIIRMNNTALSWLGYSRDEVIGKMKIMDIITPKGLEQLERNRQLFLKQGWLHDVEDQWIRKDGSILDIIVDMIAVYDKDGNYLMNHVSVFDNTERKRAEEALAESEALYRNLFENASIGMFQTSPEGRFLRINKTLASMFGYESTEEIMSTITDTATQIHANPKNRAAFLAALEQQDWFYAEQPYLRKDGSTMIGKLAIRKVLNSDGSIAYLEGIVEDITERKRAEEALRESERELRIKAQNLMEVNTTMNVLLNTMEKDQEELKERFLTNIKEQVLPYLEKLKKTPLDGVQQGLIKTAESYLDDIASPFVQKLTSNYLNLTKKEIQIASLIKEGKTSKEIADILNSNLRVISFHRENIRKKIGLKNKQGNLQIVLRSYL